MKTTQQIVGLPVISISDGNEIGMVKNVIINAAKGTVDFFVIDSGVRSLAGGVIPAGRVLGIGEYALTIQEPDDISDIVKIPAAIELIQKNITVKGTRVLTKKGSLLGEAGDIYINEDDASYAITGVEFIPGKPDMKSGIIPRSSIITFGKNLLVVNDDVMDMMLEAPHDIGSLAGQQGGIEATAEYKSEEMGGTDFFLDKAPPEETYRPEESGPAAEIPVGEQHDDLFRLDNGNGQTFASQTEPAATNVAQAEAKPDEAEMTAAELFEYRQKQYLLGKKVTKTIYSSSGGIIAEAGEIITESMIDTVKREGKLIELVMNYEG